MPPSGGHRTCAKDGPSAAFPEALGSFFVYLAGRLHRRGNSRRVFQATVASPKARAPGVHARLHAPAPGQHLKRGREVERVFAGRAWDRPVGLGTVHPSSTAAVVAVVGLPKTLRLLAERWFAFSLDLIEALADEGKVIGYSCHWGASVQHRGFLVGRREGRLSESQPAAPASRGQRRLASSSK